MNETLQTILSRRSIRRYTQEDVSEEHVENLLRAAMAAPSAGNAQTWEFVVVKQREILDKIPEFHPYTRMLKEAPMAIVVCGALDREKYKGYWVQDCAAASQNILLAAQSLGLGAVWCGIYPDEDRVAKFKDLLKIPENVVPFSIIAVGHPAEEKPSADRFDQNKIHYDKW